MWNISYETKTWRFLLHKTWGDKQTHIFFHHFPTSYPGRFFQTFEAMINAALIFRSVAGQGQGVYGEGEGLDDASICRLSIWKRHLSYNHLTCPLNKRLNVICGKDGYVFSAFKIFILERLCIWHWPSGHERSSEKWLGSLGYEPTSWKLGGGKLLTT